MNSLSGFNSQEIRRLHPYLSALLRRVKRVEARRDTGAQIEWGTDSDIRPTGNANEGGILNKAARADHQHLFKFPVAVPLSTPDGAAYYDLSSSAINIYVGNTPTTKVVAGGEASDVKPTGVADTGTAPRYSFADHSHPTALLPQGDPQSPVIDEIRYNAEDKVVRWDGSDWVPLSVETSTDVEWGTDDDVQPTKLKDAGASDRFARADHSHPTAILPQSDPQPPEIDEIRYDADDKIVRWDGTNWVRMSFELVVGGLITDVQPTGLRKTGTSTRFSRADHSHPTALLPQSDTQTPAVDEIRYTGTNRLVRWNGSAWVDFIGALPVPADPLVLPYQSQVSSPQNRQLVNHNAWDGIGDATIFRYDVNASAYRLAFTRPLVVAIASTPSGRDVWASKTNELVIKYHPSNTSGAAGVLWSRGGGTTTWSPILIQLRSDAAEPLTNDVGVLSRSHLTGATGSRRFFIRAVGEDGSFRAPLVGFPSFTATATPSPADFRTDLDDGYAYFIHDFDRVDVVRPITDGNKYPTILSHSVVAPQCRVFSTATDPSGHYVADEFWNNIWVISYFTTTSATTSLTATLPTIAVPFGIRAGRALLYLHNPQSSAITTVFAVAIRIPTPTTPFTYVSSDTSIAIPANTTVVADLGFFTFSPHTSLSHHRSHLISIAIIRRKPAEAANANKVICLGVAIIPQRSA